MSKGAGRRPEDRDAISRNWPFGSPAGRRQVSKTRRARSESLAARCMFCFKPIKKCKHCGLKHCPCVKIADCRVPSRRAKPGDPQETNPYGFEQHRTGFAEGPAALDKGPNINHEFLKQRGRL